MIKFLYITELVDQSEGGKSPLYMIDALNKEHFNPVVLCPKGPTYRRTEKNERQCRWYR